MTIIFVGQNIMGGLVLESLVRKCLKPIIVITRPDNDYPNRVQQCCLANNISFVKTPDIEKDKKVIESIRSINPDFIFCCCWGNIIKKPTLGLPKNGWINFHPSLLPLYRGPRPIQWQLINGERHGGCTAHFMVEKVDRGPVILQKTIDIALGDDGHTLRQKCGKLMGAMAIECFNLLSANSFFQGREQNHKQSTYAPHWESIRTIDWKKNAMKIYNQVRALYPYPCAQCRIGTREIEVAKVEILKRSSLASEVGIIKQNVDGYLIVGAEDFYIKINALSIDGEIVTDYDKWLQFEELKDNV